MPSAHVQTSGSTCSGAPPALIRALTARIHAPLTAHPHGSGGRRLIAGQPLCSARSRRSAFLSGRFKCSCRVFLPADAQLPPWHLHPCPDARAHLTGRSVGGGGPAPPLCGAGGGLAAQSVCQPPLVHTLQLTNRINVAFWGSALQIMHKNSETRGKDHSF